MQYLFNSNGEWIAFRDGKVVYGPSGDILGWPAEDGVNVVDPESRYFGTIYPGGRFYRRYFAPVLDTRFPGYPERHAAPLPPSLSPGQTSLKMLKIFGS